MASLFDKTPETQKINKPQYKALIEVEPLAIDALRDWLIEKGCQGCDAIVLAKAIVPQILEERKDAIHPTAASVELPLRSTLESVLTDCQQRCAELDAQNMLEQILAEHQSREEHLKHGI